MECPVISFFFLKENVQFSLTKRKKNYDRQDFFPTISQRRTYYQISITFLLNKAHTSYINNLVVSSGNALVMMLI